MRLLFWAAALAILLAPVASASPNPVPAISVRIEPSSQTVNASVSSATATFNGSVQADITQYQTLAVVLTAEMDTAWASSVAPSNMNFTSPGSQPFVVTITVPAGTTGVTGQLHVNATGRTYLFTVVQSVAAVLQTTGTPRPPANQTNATVQSNQTADGNETGSGGTGSASGGGLFGLSRENTYLLAAAVVVVFAAAGTGIALVRRKRRSRLTA